MGTFLPDADPLWLMCCTRTRKIKKSTPETGLDYQQSMDTDAASPPGDRTMDARVHYCRQCVIGPRRQPFICRDCATTNTSTSAAAFTCRRCREGTPATPYICRRCNNDNPDLDSCDSQPTKEITERKIPEELVEEIPGRINVPEEPVEEIAERINFPVETVK